MKTITYTNKQGLELKINKFASGASTPSAAPLRNSGTYSWKMG